MDKDKSICFTGHRIISKEDKKQLKGKLLSILSEYIVDGYYNFYVGGAIGFDYVAALTVCELKSQFQHIKLNLFLPNCEYRNNWSEKQKADYEKIEKYVDDIQYAFEEYTKGCMQVRNREMIDRSSICISYLNHPKGGTAYTVKYALKQGLKIINLGAEEDVRMVFDPLLKDNTVIPGY